MDYLLFIIAKKIALFLGFIFCVFTFVSAPLLGKMIFGDWLNSDVFNDRVFVIRVSSIVMLFLPLLSVYRGYLEGHRISESVMFSKCLEKVINISFILGSTLKEFLSCIKSLPLAFPKEILPHNLSKSYTSYK